MRSRSKLAFLLLLTVLLVGCREVDETICVYTVPKEKKARLLAAMIPHGSQVWIFKVSGSDDRVQSFEKDFLKFLRSVDFGKDADAEPKWELKDGWGQLSSEHPKNSGRFPRFATVYKEDKDHVERMEIAVTSLPFRSDIPWQQYVKVNVDRWRGQVKLPKLDSFELERYTKEIELDNGLVATTVNFVEPERTIPAKAESRPAKTAKASSNKPARELPFEFMKPAGWSRGGGTSISLLSFQVEDGEEKVSVTVTPAGGDLLANVNRWRGQIGLDPINRQQFEKDANELKAGDVSFNYFKLVGPQEAIWAAVGNGAGRTWFVKLRGDKDLAQRETANFESFVKSFRFKS